MSGAFVNRVLWCLVLAGFGHAAAVHAQEPPPAAAVHEEIEPRVVGRRGMTSIGFAGFLDRFYSPEEVLAGHYTLQVEGAHFLTRRIAVRGGIAGAGTIGGDEDDAGPDARALHAFAGALYHVTPGALLSPYLGADYWLQVSSRAAGDAGVLVGTTGVQAVVSSRASVFFEAGLGAALRRGAEGERLTRISGRVGIRLRL